MTHRLPHIIYTLISSVMTAVMSLMSAGCASSEVSHSVPGFREHDIIGIDISAHNGDIEFDKVRDEGRRFV
ncbi:MAG: hypothetical protein K2K77_03885, partial [Duncaniella sp.]|nr:hypothetical protein [Duncaniella sp.]